MFACETAGLGPQQRIVEVACAVVAADGSVVEQYESLVNPGSEVVWADANGVAPEELAAAPSFRDVGGVLEAMLRGRVPVAHRLPFDWVMLRSEYARVGVSAPLLPPAICTATLARRTLGGVCSLRQLCTRLDIAAPDLRTAAGDVRATVALLAALRAGGARIPTLRPIEPFPGSWRLRADRDAARPRSPAIAPTDLEDRQAS